jgi:hypothetical protein
MVNFYAHAGEYEPNEATLVFVCTHWYAGVYDTNIYNRDKVGNVC